MEGWFVFADCASGARELWNTAPDYVSAVALGTQVLSENPVTECGTGGVKWVTVFGPKGWDGDEVYSIDRVDGGVTVQPV